MAKRFGTLFLDVDDTIIANCEPRLGYDLRPGVMSQLRILSRLFHCQWLTCWPWVGERLGLKSLMQHLYGTSLNKEIKYCDWAMGHPLRKAGYVLTEGAPEDFWWLEDPLCSEEIEALKKAGKLDRYIRVEPIGYWGFAEACLELFRRAGVTEDDLKRVGGSLSMFQKEAIVQQDVKRENVAAEMGMIDLILGNEALTPEQKIQQIRTFVTTYIDSVYPPETK